MKILIAYATTEGQTRKIVRFVADWLADKGESVELWPVAEAGEVDVGNFDRAILAGSVHLGHFQSTLEDFAKDRRAELDRIDTLFLGVSLSAAGNDPEDRAGLDQVMKSFTDKTGWLPKRVEHIAGAFRFTQYDFFRSWAMRWIAAQKGEDVERDQDKEYTDWKALGDVLNDWLSA
jgi:menaquinone-dependent protoporphyrinogen oxidase